MLTAPSPLPVYDWLPWREVKVNGTAAGDVLACRYRQDVGRLQKRTGTLDLAYTPARWDELKGAAVDKVELSAGYTIGGSVQSQLIATLYAVEWDLDMPAAVIRGRLVDETYRWQDLVMGGDWTVGPVQTAAAFLQSRFRAEDGNSTTVVTDNTGGLVPGAIKAALGDTLAQVADNVAGANAATLSATVGTADTFTVDLDPVGTGTVNATFNESDVWDITRSWSRERSCNGYRVTFYDAGSRGNTGLVTLTSATHPLRWDGPAGRIVLHEKVEGAGSVAQAQAIATGRLYRKLGRESVTTIRGPAYWWLEVNDTVRVQGPDDEDTTDLIQTVEMDIVEATMDLTTYHPDQLT